jgi:MarR-like DNA-binding transcriptional regulator SgrR of sgrS sRNA
VEAILVVLRLYFFLISIVTIYSETMYAKDIHILLPSKDVILDPYGVVDQSSLWVNRQIHCQLFRLEGRSVVNDAAESYRYESPTKLVVKLRSNIRFSNGKYVTPRDVVKSILALKKKRTVLRNVLRWVHKIEVRGKDQIIFQLNIAVPQFQRFLTSPHYAILPEEFVVSAEGNNKLWSAPIGCGNFKIVSRDSTAIKLAPKLGPGHNVVFWFKDSLAHKKITEFDMVPASSPVQALPDSVFRTEKVFDPYQMFLALNTRSPQFNSTKKDVISFRS